MGGWKPSFSPEASMLQRPDGPFLAVVGLLPLVLAACSDATSSTDPRTQTPLVRVGTVEFSGQAQRSFTGIVAARVQSDLGFRVPGKVLERLVDTGQAVKRGQPLMRIDPTDLRLATRAHEEAVAAATARARQTAEDEARYRDLVSAGAVSASSYDKIKAAAESARAELKAAQAQADVARNETGYTVLLADADGVVVETLAELRQVSDAANRQTRTFEARYVLDGDLADAPLGSTISIQIADGRSAPALQVPIGAIFDSGKGPGVWLIEGETPQVAWRPVQVAGLSGEAASVVGNLKGGDRIVALGAHLLHEGEPVRLAEKEAAQSVTAQRGGQQ